MKTKTRNNNTCKLQASKMVLLDEISTLILSIVIETICIYIYIRKANNGLEPIMPDWKSGSLLLTCDRFFQFKFL